MTRASWLTTSASRSTSATTPTIRESRTKSHSASTTEPRKFPLHRSCPIHTRPTRQNCFVASRGQFELENCSERVQTSRFPSTTQSSIVENPIHTADATRRNATKQFCRVGSYRRSLYEYLRPYTPCCKMTLFPRPDIRLFRLLGQKAPEIYQPSNSEKPIFS